ncbi:MAG: transporter substrate-binding domain-containing protein [Firmicutes bacterium]|nr:transporter substrate-binding domain-containing protein [Bacillota bacterium]
MKTKKILSLILVLILAMTVFAGCGSDDKTPSSAAGSDSKVKEYVPDDNSVLKTKVLRVGMECGYAPYNWAQNDDSNGAVPIKGTSDYAYGYDVMMAKKLAEALDYTVEIHKIDWDSLPVAVQSGKIDCVIAGQSITSERLQSVDFTTPYYYASVVGLTKKDSKYANVTKISELEGVKCTSQINTIWYKVLDQIPKVNKLPAQETVPNMLVALNAGSVDFVCTDMPTAMAACVAYPDFKLIDFEGEDSEPFKVSDEDVNIGISVAKGNTELVDKLNGVLATMNETDFENMMKEAISVQPLSDVTGE